MDWRGPGISLLNPPLSGQGGSTVAVVSGLGLAALTALLFSLTSASRPVRVALMGVGAVVSLPIATVVLLWHLPARSPWANLVLRVSLFALAFGAAPPFFINDADGTLSDGLSGVVAGSRVLFVIIVLGTAILLLPHRSPLSPSPSHPGSSQRS